jgi:hypothetical protein
MKRQVAQAFQPVLRKAGGGCPTYPQEPFKADMQGDPEEEKKNAPDQKITEGILTMIINVVYKYKIY